MLITTFLLVLFLVSGVLAILIKLIVWLVGMKRRREEAEIRRLQLQQLRAQEH